MDFFTNLGIASTTYTEPIRVQAKLRPAVVAVPGTGVQGDVQVRGEMVSKYGLDEIDEVEGWDELDLENGGGGGGGAGKGKGKGAKREKKKGLGAVALVEDE